MGFAILGPILGFSQTTINGKTAVGTWKTVDDETGKAKSYVKISENNGVYEAKIIKLLDPETLKDSKTPDNPVDLLCSKCPEGKGKDQPILGLKMIWGLTAEDDNYEGGKIMDPKSGKIYTCTMELDEEDKSGDVLLVKGWIAFFNRTQTWYRVD